MFLDKFLYIPVKMLGRQLVKRSMWVEHRPERLDAVGVGHAAHVFGDREVDRLVLEGQPVNKYGRIQDREFFN